MQSKSRVSIGGSSHGGRVRDLGAIAVTCLLVSLHGCNLMTDVESTSGADTEARADTETGEAPDGDSASDAGTDADASPARDNEGPCAAADKRPLPEPAPGRLFALERDATEVSADGDSAGFAGRTLDFSDREGASDNQVAVLARWTSRGLYLGFEVDDPDIDHDDEADAWKNDGVEVAVDPDGDGGSDFEGDERKWVVESTGDLRPGTAEPGYWGVPEEADGIAHSGVETDDGYRVELMVEWSVLGGAPERGNAMGIAMRVNDRDAGETEHFMAEPDADLASPSSWGPLALVGESCRHHPTGGMDGGRSDTDAGPERDSSDDTTLDAGPDTRVLREDKQMGHSTWTVASDQTVIVDGEVTLSWEGFDSPDRGALEAIEIAGTVTFADEGDRLILDQTAENLALNTKLRGGARFGDGKGVIIYRGTADLVTPNRKEKPRPHYMLFPPDSGRAVLNGVAWPDGSGARADKCSAEFGSNIGFSYGQSNGDLVMKNTLVWGFAHNLFYWYRHDGSLTLIDSVFEHTGSRGITPPEGGLEMRNVTVNVGGKNAKQLHSCGSSLNAFQVETDDGSERTANLENVHILSREQRYDGEHVRYPYDGPLYGTFYDNDGHFTFNLTDCHSEVGGNSPSRVTQNGNWGSNAKRLDHWIVRAVENTR